MSAVLRLAFILILFLFSCSTHSRYIRTKTDPTKINKIVYIENTFTNEESKIIIKAFKSWEAKTRNSFRFNYELFFNPQTINYIKKENALIIGKISANDLEVKNLDEFQKKKQKITIGFFTNRYSIPHIFVVEGRIDGNLYEALLLHEIGHFLGYKHSNSKNSIMFPHIDEGAREITENDVEEFCEIYFCNFGGN